MRAVIYYLTAFGFIDGDFDADEKLFVRRFVRRLVEDRARRAMGDAWALNGDVIDRWTEHFHEVLDEIDDEIQALFTESVADGEDSQAFVAAKLKLRCFELFRRFDEANRQALLGSVDELMLADGVVHPAEKQLRDEIEALLAAPIELAEVDIEPVVEHARLVIGKAEPRPVRTADHPFLQRLEQHYPTDRERFLEQAEDDLALIERFTDKLNAQRAAGRGGLDGAEDFSTFSGQGAFLDGHVYVVPPQPGEEVEILAIGDLHGCYSCLKAALMQADFFAKAEAYHADPANNPRMLAVFLGDYIDRGKFSYNGVLRAVMQLYLAAPESVFVLRGNHEYYIEHNGRVLAPVRPAEAWTSIASIAPNELFAAYMRLFETLPSSLVFDRTLFVHAGIPREDTLEERFTGPASLNDKELRFQMLWSDPSDADVIPLDLQKASARFPFGKRQFKAFMSRLGLTTMIRGHERVVEGFKTVWDDPDAMLLSLFSAGGARNEDLPATSNYREVTPMALTIRYKDGQSRITPFALDYERYNDPANNAFFRDSLKL